MPANLPPQYFEVEEKYRQAKTVEEKLEALEEMLAIIPKHKGTEKLQAEIKQKISKLKRVSSEKTKKGKSFDPFLVEKSGAAQIAILGPPNSGKSTFLHVFTNARPEVAEYPFTTFYPTPGMMPYEDVQIQLLDLPPIGERRIEGNFANALRRVEGAILLLNAQSPKTLEELEMILEALRESKIEVGTEKTEVPSHWFFLPAFILINKVEKKEHQEVVEIIRELYKDRFLVHGTSLHHLGEEEKTVIKKYIFNIAGIIRVYSKPPGKPPDFE
ncbi:MAG: 50S ribosome-binding GTPase, partial [Atribacterota bacterium]|nr:50S ribosome-binding GTPase [Atribacterota bacterium]